MLTKDQIQLGDIITVRDGRQYVYVVTSEYGKVFLRDHGYHIGYNTLDDYDNKLKHRDWNILDVVDICHPIERYKITKVKAPGSFTYPYAEVIKRTRRKETNFITLL